ncbi:MAG: riboflavin synthase [Spartobacteria bacterium AMD-G4]|nr:MAG: riboflavin synthase [Spartobacteria bacterium AMD-G4]
MFTGLVEEMGLCESLRIENEGARLAIRAPLIAGTVRIGDSVAVNGCCLTVTSATDGVMHFDLLMETLRLTNLESLTVGAGVNLERSLAADGRLGGHFVQGHIDTTTKVRSVTRQGSDLRLDFEMPPEFACYFAYKGSVAISGVSLTVAEVGKDMFTVWIIPHTASATNLGTLAAGSLVNLECDMLAKYTARILDCRRE